MRTAIISADSHVLEPGNLWQQRLDRKYRDRAPRIFQDAATGKYKFGGEGVPAVFYSGLFAVDKRGQELAVHNAGPASEKDVPPGGWNPQRRLLDQDVDGVSAEVLYASLAFPMFRVDERAYVHVAHLRSVLARRAGVGDADRITYSHRAWCAQPADACRAGPDRLSDRSGGSPSAK